MSSEGKARALLGNNTRKGENACFDLAVKTERSVGISKSKKRYPQLINWSSNRIYIFISRFSLLTDVNDSFSTRSYGFIPVSLLYFTGLNRTLKRASDRRLFPRVFSFSKWNRANVGRSAEEYFNFFYAWQTFVAREVSSLVTITVSHLKYDIFLLFCRGFHRFFISQP